MTFDPSTVFTANLLNGLLDTLWVIVPIVIPVVLAIAGFKIGWNFLRGQLK